MFEFVKSPMKMLLKQNSVGPGCPGSSGYNPFDSESNKKQTLSPSRRASSEPNLIVPDFGGNPFDSDQNRIPDLGANPSDSDEKRSLDFRVNPFDSESNMKQPLTPSRRTSSEPNLIVSDFGVNPFDSDENRIPDFCANPFDSDEKRSPDFRVNPFDSDEKRNSASSSHVSSGNKYKNNLDYSEALKSRPSSSNVSSRNKYNNNFKDSEALENQSVRELENYAVRKAEATTETVSRCLKIAQDIRGNALNTLVTLHEQGVQITRTHLMATDMGQDLSLGEKLLGSLGGVFSKPWRPKKSHPISGPTIITKDVPTISKENNKVQRDKLGLSPAPKPRSATQAPPTEPTDSMQKVEIQWAKQDDALSDLSNILFDLKDMAVDMGTELDRHAKCLDHLHVDVDELDSRVKGANQRARRLLGKK